MRAFAPGKLVLTGAYVVLEGAPALVVATSRGAVADAARPARFVTPEVRAALGSAAAPEVDASALFTPEGRKLGLGASAAILVASLAAREARDLGEARVRADLFARARAAHAAAQSGGSGVDVAASVYGGALRYSPGDPSRVSLPAGLRLTVLACPTSASTRELRATVDALAARDPGVHRAHMGALHQAARAASAAVDAGDRRALVAAIDASSRALAALGAASGAPIVPPALAGLTDAARDEGAAFSVSGAGGGDVAVFAGSAPPSPAFLERARAAGLFVLDVDLDEKGVRALPAARAEAARAVPAS